MKPDENEVIEASYYDPALPILKRGWWWKLAFFIAALSIPTTYLLWQNGHWPFVG